MLAQTAESVAAALERIGTAAVEWKLDGVRVQIHRWGATAADVRVFTRTLDDVTERVPELVEAALSLPVESVVLDGEAIALHPDGRPRPFQQTGSRMGSRTDVARARAQWPLTLFVFDLLHLDGTDLLAAPATVRTEAAGHGRAGPAARPAAWSPTTPRSPTRSSRTRSRAGTRASSSRRSTSRTRRAGAASAG